MPNFFNVNKNRYEIYTFLLNQSKSQRKNSIYINI